MATWRDPHLNVFHAYRGGPAGEGARFRQLEDNLTRALGIVLATLGPRREAAPLLERMGVDERLCEEPFQVLLQVPAPSPGWPPPSRRTLLAIVTEKSVQGAEAVLPGEAAPGGARADMVLLWPDGALVVESELKPKPEEQQMKRLRGVFSPAREALCTWSELARAVREMRPRDAAERFLLQQFEEYLRMNGFGGFTEEHFAYFAWSPERRASEPVTKRGAQQAMRELLRQLKAAWGVDWELRVGQLRDSDRTLWGKLEPTPRPAPHLSLEISTDGLHVFANVETKRPFERFVASWERDPQGLRRALAVLSGSTDGASL